MLTRNRKRRERLNPNADINLVNLVDLAFVLLIIFMITAPMLQGGIEVQLPRAAATPLKAEQGVIVSVNRQGSIFIGEVPIRSGDDFKRTLPSYLRASDNKTVYIKGDKDVNYGRVLEVFQMVKELEITDVSLVVDPPPEKK